MNRYIILVVSLILSRSVAGAEFRHMVSRTKALSAALGAYYINQPTKKVACCKDEPIQFTEYELQTMARSNEIARELKQLRLTPLIVGVLAESKTLWIRSTNWMGKIFEPNAQCKTKLTSYNFGSNSMQGSAKFELKNDGENITVQSRIDASVRWLYEDDVSRPFVTADRYTKCRSKYMNVENDEESSLKARLIVDCQSKFPLEVLEEGLSCTTGELKVCKSLMGGYYFSSNGYFASRVPFNIQAIKYPTGMDEE